MKKICLIILSLIILSTTASAAPGDVAGVYYSTDINTILNGAEIMSINIGGQTLISAEDSKVKIFVIPTDEELVMTEDAYALMMGTYDVHTNFTYSFQSSDYVNKARAEGLKKDLAKNPDLEKIIAK